MLARQRFLIAAPASQIRCPAAGEIVCESGSQKEWPPREGDVGSHLILHDFPSPGVEAAWRDFLERVDIPAHYNSPEFFREPHLRANRPFAVLALQKERVAGVLTGIHEGDQVSCGTDTRPQICLDKTIDLAPPVEALVQGLLAEATSARLLTVYSWTLLDPFLRYGFRFRPMEGVVVLDLTQGKERVLKQFDTNRRRNIRLSIQRNVEVSEPKNEEEVAILYEIYKDWCKRKNRSPIPYEMELAISRSTRANRKTLLARVEGKVVAGTVIRFFTGGLVEYSRNNSLPEYLKFRPNDLLQWKAIEWACDEGFLRYSMGGSSPFHLKFGGQIVPIFRYRLDRTWLRRHDLREAILDVGRRLRPKQRH